MIKWTTLIKGGRPQKNIDKKTFENLCAIQCTKDEICIDLNEQASDFTCVAFESGGKRAVAPEGIKLDTFDDEEDI